MHYNKYNHLITIQAVYLIWQHIFGQNTFFQPHMQVQQKCDSWFFQLPSSGVNLQALSEQKFIDVITTF